jgi:hypothetical protein
MHQLTLAVSSNGSCWTPTESCSIEVFEAVWELLSQIIVVSILLGSGEEKVPREYKRDDGMQRQSALRERI